MSQNGKNLVEVKDLKTYFPVRKGMLKRTVGHVKAVDGVSFKIESGKTLGLVGESGCGKTTVGRSMLRLTKATSGEVFFQGHEVFKESRAGLKRLRRNMQYIFQDPYGSLNPRMTVGSIIAEPLRVHSVGSPEQRCENVNEILKRVGLSSDHARSYPHEFSGGQRQRIAIARALVLEPDFVICDEPVSALDVSIQSQIINLLQDLQRDMRLTYLFIAHDLAVIEHISDYVAVMYLGRIVEYTSAKRLYESPLHPYTKALISAIPESKPIKDKQRIVLDGEVPSPSNPPLGCPFHPRCPVAEARCRHEVQSLADVGTETEHLVACFRALEGEK
ncbi:MAG: dipeptide ABC transporter ATP-binding protein [Anaerohalosphaera sp.]|nr:dipeptide ABC transporter ATP-binding protein [Anaerohalosphaera sp.]